MLLALEIAVEAMLAGSRAAFFSLEYSELDIYRLFGMIDRNPDDFSQRFECDTSDAISADYIIEHLSRAAPGTVVIVDYLQLLDQSRSKPGLDEQVYALKSFAEQRRIIMLFVSQIDRAFDLSGRPCPGLADVRLPNPLNLELFNRSCFLNDGEIRLSPG